MSAASATIRYRAISMGLAAYLDGHYVEMHIVTDAGERITVVCDKDSIFAIQRHIEQIGRDCPEIATWRLPISARARNEIEQAYEAAPSEGWPASLQGAAGTNELLR